MTNNVVKMAHMLWVALMLTLTTVSPASAQEFCWKDSKTRGAGAIPDSCAPGKEMVGLLCYDKCPVNTKRVGIDCHSVCPAGMRDDGLFCRMSEYWRDSYAWKGSDGLSDRGMYNRCESAHGKGNCEKKGAIVYEKCQSGYSAVTVDICRPNQPNCGALGLGGQFDLSCAKKVQIASEPKTGVCTGGEQEQAGLCYKQCGDGFNGIGPVCWGKVPAGWVDCGMGAAKDSKACAMTVFSQVSSVAQMAAFVASLGTSSAGTAGTQAQKAGRLAELQKKFTELKAAWENLKNNSTVVQTGIMAFDTANKARKGYVATNNLMNSITEEDIARASAQLAAILDPSGVAATIAAYTYPKCSKYFPTSTQPQEPAAGLRWKAGPSVPGNAVIGGYDTPRSMIMPICRAEWGGAKHPGKLYGTNCAIPYGGREISLSTFEVLVNDTDALVWVSGPAIPSNAVIGGVENGGNLPVCRVTYDSGMHPGKIWSGKCWIGFGGVDMQFADFEVLTNVGAAPVWTQGPRVNSNGVVSGFEGAVPLNVCRASYAGATHPGEVWNNLCNIGYGGGVLTLPNYEVLGAGSTPLSWVSGPSSQPRAVIGGSSGSFQMAVCRADYNGVKHAGKVWGTNCNVGVNGAERIFSNFDVLVQN
ncbi:MAG: DM9 repeat-containing protein [Polyangiales bacterium]